MKLNYGRTAVSIGTVIVLGTVVSGCGAVGGGSADNDFQGVYNSCVTDKDRQAIELADGGQTLIIQTSSPGDAVSCVLSGVGIPDSTLAKINAATTASGQQSETQDGITYTWSLAPSSYSYLSPSLNLIVTRN